MPEWRRLTAKKEATRRVKARRSCFSKPKLVQERIADEAAAAKGLEKLIAWAKKRGFEVRFGKDKKDYIFYSLKRITICSKPSLQSQMIGLLHECGHLLLINDKATYTRRFGRGWPVADKKDKRAKASATHRLQLFEEELEAWNRGEKLAQRLKLRVNPNLWAQWRAFCLKSYAEYVAKSATLAKEPKAKRP